MQGRERPLFRTGGGEEFTCLALEGVDTAGHPFTKTRALEEGKPWPLWCLVRLCAPGRRELTLEVTIDSETIPLSMTAAAYGNTDAEAGCGDRDSLARLSWLNSTRGISDEIPAPFAPVSTGRDDVKATVYENKNGELLICFASFAETTVRFTPTGAPFDDPARGAIFMPRVDGLQERADYRGGALELLPSSGVMLWAGRG